MLHQIDNFDGIPASLVALAETVGLRATLSLIHHFGGQELRFPVRPKPDHPIIKALGEEDGMAVCRFYEANTIYVPRGVHNPQRWRQVKKMADKGLGRSQIARELGISVRHVSRLLNDTPRESTPDDRQASLF